MRPLRALLFRLGGLFRKEQRDRDLAEELESHLTLHIEDNLRAGMNADDARRNAILKLGGIEPTKEAYRDRRSLPVIEILIQDLRYGIRTLLKNPGFATVAVLTLALGIGANTAMYTIVRAVMLRPPDMPEPSRLVRVYESNPGLGRLAWSASVANYASWKDQSRTLELAAFQGYAVNWTADGGSERLEGLAATSSFLPVLGPTVHIGRWFADDEQREGQHRIVVLAGKLWETRFGQDPGVVGRKLLINGETFTVIGVASGGLTIPAPPDLWVPLVIDADAGRANRQYTVVGRLRPGFTLGQAQAEMRSIARGLEQQFPESDKGWSVTLVPLLRWLVSAEIRAALLVLLGAVGMVLLIACANVANLQLARSEARRKELAIRAALGAGSSRISRQLLTESLLLSLIGATLGVGFGQAIVGIARRALVDIVPRAAEISIDMAVLGFTLGIAVVTGLLFGMTPLFQLGMTRSLDALRQAGRTSQPASRGRLRAALVVGQLSLATLLLIGAGLLMQSFARLQAVSPGVDADSVLTARIALPRARYADGPSISRFFSRLTDTLGSSPGVQTAGVSNAIPLGSGSVIGGDAVAVPPPDPSLAQPVNAGWLSVDGHFFAALRVPVLHGRIFGPRDEPDTRPVFVLSRQAARSIYGAENPVGRQLRLNDTVGEVIGVVGDIRMRSLADPPDRLVYVPLAQGGRFGGYALFVRMQAGSPDRAATLIRERLREIDPGLSAFAYRPMHDWVDSNSARNRIRTWVLAMLAAVATALGMVGIYGVLAYLVNLRRHEFGVRLALGAQPGKLLRLVLGQGLGLAAAGIAAGLLAAFLLTRVLESLLFAVGARDPITFLGVAMLLLFAALIACYVPARRAAHADPMTALRSE
jgi:putative ABC transport system permease protein